MPPAWCLLTAACMGQLFMALLIQWHIRRAVYASAEVGLACLSHLLSALACVLTEPPSSCQPFDLKVQSHPCVRPRLA